MDYDHEVYPSAMEPRIGLYGNLYHGHQPRDWKVLQPCGKVHLSYQMREGQNIQHIKNVSNNNILVNCRIFGIP